LHTLTQQCSANTYIDTDYPTTTLFANETGKVGCKVMTVERATWEAFFYFSLSSLSGSSISDLSTIPSTATIESATLFLSVAGTATPISVAHCASAWNEATLYYDNASGHKSSDVITSTTVPQTGSTYTWITIDLTSAVRAWVAGSSPNYGIYLYPTDYSWTTSGRQFNYRSLRYSSSGYRPYIEIKATY
jgi:hypothetical protein